jgi:hypothetical protein
MKTRVATCERIVGQLSDYERGIWTPKPGERVRIISDGALGTFEAPVDEKRAIVTLDQNTVDGWDNRLWFCAWNQLAPAPPPDCQCPACRGDGDPSSNECTACDCGACPFVHECGCGGHGCGCPAGGCSGGAQQAIPAGRAASED